MPEPFSVIPHEGPNAGRAVASVDRFGNWTVQGVMYLAVQSAVPVGLSGMTALYVDASGALSVPAMRVSGTVTVSGAVAVTGAVQLAGPLTVAGNAQFDEDLGITNSLSVGNTSVFVGQVDAQDGVSISSGSLSISTPGEGIRIATGANATAGTATLVGGTVDVVTSAVTNSSLVFLSQASGSVVNLGALTVSAISPATRFTVKSTNVLDTSSFNWMIVEGI